VANISGTTGRLEKKAAQQEQPAACEILLVGPEALALRATVEKLLPAGKIAEAVDGAESILEAVLMSGGGGRSSDIPVILAGISQELDQIEPAVRSMRKVYPKSRIVLLCEPGDEVLCRKAKGWGANDYVILPADTTILRTMLSPESATPATPPVPAAAAPTPAPIHQPRKPSNGHSHITPAALVPKPIEIPHPVGQIVEPGAEMQPGDAGSMSPADELKHKISPVHDLSLPALPLVVQAVLFNDLLLGRTDFVDRVIATLQAYVKWGGTLKFEPAEATTTAVAPPVAEPHGMRATVGLPHQPAFGTLHVEPAPGAVPNSSVAAALSQAAHWLASLLSIARRYEQLRALAITDELSGAYNRRYFTKFMSGLLERARQNRFRVTLLLFDIDDFKKYNDTFGHASGDAIIRELIKLLRSCTRPHDLVARLGGDEFAAVYWDNEAPRTPNSEHPRDAVAATERFRKAVEGHSWSSACNIQGEVSISGGLATFPWDADSLETLMRRADEALLRAKAAGKNVFLLHGEGCEGDPSPPPPSHTDDSPF
jgi:diguanylate cyclase (GGDEF)-like protein